MDVFLNILYILMLFCYNKFNNNSVIIVVLLINGVGGVKNKLSIFFSILFCVATLFMGVGYASINSVSFNISGEVTPKVQDGIFITDVSYNEDLSSNVFVTDSKINSAYQTNLDSNIVLTQDAGSQITYNITVYNSNDSPYCFYDVDYILGGNTYSNENIIFKLNDVVKGDLIDSNSSLEFSITFYYKDGNNISDTSLSSLLNFNFILATDKILVNFDGNGSEVVQNSKYVYNGESFGDMPVPTLENYFFVGWFTAKSGGLEYTKDTIVDLIGSEITLYARWSAKPIAINNVPTITMSQLEAKKYYGQIVDIVNGSTFNPNVNDSRVWRVFYIDTENKYGDGKGTIYLKADELSSKKMRFSTSFAETNIEGYTSIFSTLSNTRYYKISGDNVVDSNGNVINTLYLKLNPTYAIGRKKINSTVFYENEKAAAYLSDPSQFIAYTDSRTNYAIGSPPIEMWMDSWNSVYGSSHLFEYQYNVNVDGTTENQKLPGYQLKYNNSVWGQAAGVDENLDISTIDNTNMYKTTNGLWFSSPAIIYKGASLVRLSSVGFIGNATINMNYAYSPVVSLNNESIVYTTSYVE